MLKVKGLESQNKLEIFESKVFEWSNRDNQNSLRLLMPQGDEYNPFKL